VIEFIHHCPNSDRPSPRNVIQFHSSQQMIMLVQVTLWKGVNQISVVFWRSANRISTVIWIGGNQILVVNGNQISIGT
jgi:hypothetical protein